MFRYYHFLIIVFFICLAMFLTTRFELISVLLSLGSIFIVFNLVMLLWYLFNRHSQNLYLGLLIGKESLLILFSFIVFDFIVVTDIEDTISTFMLIFMNFSLLINLLIYPALKVFTIQPNGIKFLTDNWMPKEGNIVGLALNPLNAIHWTILHIRKIDKKVVKLLVFANSLNLHQELLKTYDNVEIKESHEIENLS